MKAQFSVCILLLFVSACSGVPVLTPNTLSPDLQTRKPESLPASLNESAIIPTKPSAVPTHGSGELEIPGCTLTLMPAGFFPGGDRLLGFREYFLEVYNLKSDSIEIQIQLPSRVI